jgi:hypothetical protein
MAGKQFSLDSRMDLVSTLNTKEKEEDSEEEDKGRTYSVS